MQKTIHSDSYRLLTDWLKAQRQRRGLTMREVAVRIDVPHTWVTKIENRDRRLDVAEYVRYCRLLSVNPHTGIAILARAMRTEHRSTRAGVRRK